MEFTWITIIASLCMGIGAVLVFVFAVKKNYFRNVEDALTRQQQLENLLIAARGAR